MPPVLQIVIDVFFVVSIGSIAAMFAWSLVVGARRSDRAQQALIESNARSQENNRVSSDAALGLAKVLSEMHAAQIVDQDQTLKQITERDQALESGQVQVERIQRVNDQLG